ncbi:MAG: hypothetical protein VKL59_23990 [Nostocaceae cyanobacterium]|nr:hypothetical protein [Nostocaceae cyanobacterium]
MFPINIALQGFTAILIVGITKQLRQDIGICCPRIKSQAIAIHKHPESKLGFA